MLNAKKGFLSFEHKQNQTKPCQFPCWFDGGVLRVSVGKSSFPGSRVGKSLLCPGLMYPPGHLLCPCAPVCSRIIRFLFSKTGTCSSPNAMTSVDISPPSDVSAGERSLLKAPCLSHSIPSPWNSILDSHSANSFKCH